MSATSSTSESARKGTFTIVVMGEGVEFQVHPEVHLAVPSKKALEETHQTELDLSKWVLTDANNRELDFSQTEEAAGVRAGSVLTLTPRKSSGG